jgi:hypothetical protein
VFTKTYIKDNINQIHIGGYGDGGHFAFFVMDDGRLFASGYNGRHNIDGIMDSVVSTSNPYPRRML